MPEDFTTRELGIMLKNLECKIVEGFRTTHEKQDHTNGNVSDLLAWKAEREPLLATIEEKENNIKEKKREYFWKTIDKGFELFWKVAAIIAALAIGGANYDKIANLF